VHNDTIHYNYFMALWTLSRTTWMSRYQKKHSPTHTYHSHQSSLSAFSIFCDPWHMASSLFNLCALTVFFHNLSTSFVWSTSWRGTPPYISPPNHCILFLFAVHAHIFTTCFAVVPKVCHLILVSLNPLLRTLSCSLMPHIHLNILISAR